MWWSMLVIVIIVVIVATVLIARKLKADRKRFARWNNLHERGKLFSAQLADMRNAVEHKESVESTAKTPDAPPPATGPKLFWPKHNIRFRTAGTTLFADSPMNRETYHII